MLQTEAIVKIQDRTARARLAVRRNPYWRQISEGCHLGYYKGPRGGTWRARFRRPGTAGPYATTLIGNVDDVGHANGSSLLDWKQALDKAMEWFAVQVIAGPSIDRDQTVRCLVKPYIAMRDARDSMRVQRPVRSDASYKLGRYVLADKGLAEMRVADLSDLDLQKWQKCLVQLKASTKRRLINDLKAAMNAAYIANRKAFPPDFAETVRIGLKIIDTGDEALSPARDNQILEDAQIRAIVQAAECHDDDGDFGRLVLLLAATGARFSQVKRLQVRDVQFDRARIMMPSSRKGRVRTSSVAPIPVTPDILDALAPAVIGRAAFDPLLCRWSHIQIGAMKWERSERGPWQTPSAMARPWKQMCQTIGLDAIVPYALRHSSIVRGIRNGLPIRLVAAMHDTSVVMIERHYSRWIVDGLEDMASRVAISLR